MRLYFGLMMVALAFAAVSGAAMSWDGSYLLFKILDLQSPIPAHGRIVNIPLHWIVLLASRFTSNLSILQIVYGLVYVSIPLLALAISWWVVRGHAETLFIWPALSIGLGTLPGQFCFVCEAIFAITLFWPIILVILTRMRTHQVIVVLPLVVAIFFAHFISSVLFAIGASFAFAIGLCSRDERRWMWIWATGLSAMAGLKLLMFWAFSSGYERSQLSMAVLKYYYTVSVDGLPLLSVICAWFAGFVIFFLGLLSTSSKRKFPYIMHAVELISLLTAGGLLVIWARDPYLWRDAISFRLWAFFTSLPFMMMAAVEALIYIHRISGSEDCNLNYRIRIVQIIGIIFLFVISVQSTAWFNLTNILRETIDQSEHNCISESSIHWLARTPLAGWSPSYSILLQDRAPEKLIQIGDGCTEASFSEAIRLAPWDIRSRMGGWFDLGHSGLSLTQRR